ALRRSDGGVVPVAGGAVAGSAAGPSAAGVSSSAKGSQMGSAPRPDVSRQGRLRALVRVAGRWRRGMLVPATRVPGGRSAVTERSRPMTNENERSSPNDLLLQMPGEIPADQTSPTRLPPEEHLPELYFVPLRAPSAMEIDMLREGSQ